MEDPTATTGPEQPAPPTTAGYGHAPQFFLRTKLLAPRPVPSLLPRPRLSERLERNLQHAVTLVTANAGSGKTTLVADFVRTQTRHVWYQLDATDADPGVFVGYLATGIRNAVPAFGETTLAYVAEAAGEVALHPERAADVLLNEMLERVEERIVIVLDDYHHLGTDTPVHRAIDRLISYMPDVMHLVIVSREMPPLALARLRARASIDVIDRADLLFTSEETQELFRTVFGLELTSDQLAEYTERTQGWITALQLVRQVVKRSSDEQGDLDLVRVLRQSERDIFDYFAEEVFDAESADAKSTLLLASMLDGIETEACAVLFPDLNAAALLADLVRRNVFVTVAGDAAGEEYRIHPLFQSFLRRRLRAELGDARFVGEQRRCAAYFAARRQWERATSHYLAAGDVDEAAALLAASGPEWIAAGKLAALAACADALPAEALASHPRALMARAEVARLRGDFDASRALYRRTVGLLGDAGDTAGEAEALHALASISRRRGEFAETFSLLDRATSLAGARSLVAAKCGNTRGLCLLQTGKIAEGERELRAALDVAEALGDEHHVRLIAHNLGGPAMVRGDFSEAIHWLRRMLATDPSRPPVPQEATGHLNIARCLNFLGEFAECERHLGLALERCQQFSIDGLIGEIFEGYGNLWREQLEFVRAADFYRRAVRAYADAAISPALREVHEEQALLLMETGDFAGARLSVERLIAARRAAGDDMGVHTASLTRGRVLVAQRACEDAIATLEPSLEFYKAHSFHYYEAQASFALAVCAWMKGDLKNMLDRLRRALDLSARYDYEYWLRREVMRHPTLFDEPEARDLLPSDVVESLPERPAPPAATPPIVIEPAAPAADLTLRLLGPVEIVRDPERPIPSDAWTTRRARDILCFIVSRPGRRASKDAIIDSFWGESDFDVVEKNFHPTISHIRKALNKNQLIKENFVLYRDGDYLLSPEHTYRIDVEEVDRLHDEADAARRSGDTARQIACLEEALAHYRGEFVQGTYDVWAEEPRSYYSERRLSMLEALARAAAAANEWPRVLDLVHRVLRDDPFREDIHCLAMRAHAAMGNRGAVKDQFETLRALLDRELGVEPDPATRRTYTELLKS